MLSVDFVTPPTRDPVYDVELTPELRLVLAVVSAAVTERDEVWLATNGAWLYGLESLAARFGLDPVRWRRHLRKLMGRRSIPRRTTGRNRRARS